MKRVRMTHRFVEFIPAELDQGVIYISTTYATAAHRCSCGCGKEVVTAFSPTDWRLIFDGDTVTLDPSIGNWSFPCRSHYWIRNNRVRWAAPMSRERIEANRTHDRVAKVNYYNALNTAGRGGTNKDLPDTAGAKNDVATTPGRRSMRARLSALMSAARLCMSPPDE
jgi:uncharacterized protein DUF6527